MGGVEVGGGETAAVFLAEQRLELLKSAALEDWSSALLAAGIVVEAYGTIAGAAPYRRETVVADHVGRECATGAPPTVTCKRVRVTVSYRPVSGGGGPGHERRGGSGAPLRPPRPGARRGPPPPAAARRPWCSAPRGGQP